MRQVLVSEEKEAYYGKEAFTVEGTFGFSDLSLSLV